jgi:hypothetical protein
MPDALPYTDTKPAGHADFYFAVNATFRFMLARFGPEKLRAYWRQLGAEYYRPVSERWQSHGLAGVAEYWRAFFAAEPAAEVEVIEQPDAVQVEVRRCPAIHHFRENGREIVPCFCQHCYFVTEAIAQPAGFTVRVQGGNGQCVQRFFAPAAYAPPQNLEAIATAS